MVQWNIVNKTRKWKCKKAMVEQCGGTVEQCWWNTHSGTSEKAMVEQCGGTVE